jgi:hypothetical protein
VITAELGDQVTKGAASFESKRRFRDYPPPSPADGLAVPYRKLVKEIGVDPDLRAGYAEAAALLDPVLAGRAVGRWICRELRERDSSLEIIRQRLAGLAPPVRSCRQFGMKSISCCSVCMHRQPNHCAQFCAPPEYKSMVVGSGR